ncbi:putative exonuclease V [Phyllosticta citriasiana]|uniref:putative exonuclease V n=1 Tax=Phyllosticta citriasiana TaxID=595635 RepID=UPI0030FDC2E2
MNLQPEAHIEPFDQSDYGSDLDSEGEQLLADVLARLEAGKVKTSQLDHTINNVPPGSTLLPRPIRHPVAVFQVEASLAGCAEGQKSPLVHRDDDEAPARKPETSETPTSEPAQVEPDAAAEPSPDDRSPLERFRTLPKKPLSVTDIVSPAWCELQYWYTLTKHGRKRRTPAMKEGSRVHKTLEEQVHTTVEVLVKTREDAWGLKIWNIIQGLRTLRNLGFTRELEVWGVVDGQVVNGIIDELSYTRPDTRRRRKSKSASPEPKESGEPASDSKQVFITDVKTRGSKTLPSGSSLRPTEMQLMLYRKLLVNLATNQVNADTVLERYRLKPHEQFTDAFIAEVAQLDFNFSDEPPNEDTAMMNSQDDSISELVAHNTLNKLWQLMIQEFSRAMPGPDAVNGLLRAEFRESKTGDCLGNKFFDYDEEVLGRYLADEMSWWRGERGAKGVDVEEAFKCRFCDFAEICDWRKNKVDEAVAKSRQRSTPKEPAAAAA